MKNINIFRTVVLGLFAALAIIGFIFFSIYKPSNRDENVVKVGSVKIWGTYPSNIMDSLLKRLREINNNYSNVSYTEKDSSTFNMELLEAIASGNSPDLILISQKTLYKNKNKIYEIPYNTISPRVFKDNYLDAFSVFDSGNGILAIPFMIDPMIMYYNKTIFNSSGVVLPPKEWQNFVEITPKLTKKDNDGTIFKSAISFGETINVINLKQIISTLFFQSENEIVNFNKGQLSTVDFDSKNKNPISGIIFFNEFSNQLSNLYSWNRTLPNSKDYFIAGNLATYFGFVSEITNIRKKNPNLNFDVAEIPATSGSFNKSVFANVWGFAIMKNSQNISGAYNVANAFVGELMQRKLSELTYLPSVRKDLVSEVVEDSYMDIFNKEAIYAKTWIDPSDVQTDQIFKYMVDSIKTGSSTPMVAVNEAFKEINYLFEK